MLVVSVGWSAYRNLKTAGNERSVVILEEAFVNSDECHTNSNELIWSQFKNWIATMHMAVAMVAMTDT